MKGSLGRIVTCDRCGKQVFQMLKSSAGTKGINSDANFNKLGGWEEVQMPGVYSERKMLCDDCLEAYTNIKLKHNVELRNFMEEGNDK